MKFILSVVILIAFLVFVAQNTNYVELKILNLTYQVPLFLMLLLSFGVGFGLPSIYFSLKQGIISKRLRRISKIDEGFLRGELTTAAGGDLVSLKILAKGEGLKVSVDDKRGDALRTRIGLYTRDQEVKTLINRLKKQEDMSINSLKALRDESALRESWEESLEFQKKLFDICEKWEKSTQREILGLLYAYCFWKSGNEIFLSGASAYAEGPYIMAIQARKAGLEGQEKELRKIVEKASSAGFGDWLIFSNLDNQRVLAGLVDVGHLNATPEALALAYIKLHMPSKAQELSQDCSERVRLCIALANSHKDSDALCLKYILEGIKPFICRCGREYNFYRPFCESCLSWDTISLRRGENAFGPGEGNSKV
ncbi:MAG: LapA family protein [Aquificaceae bacterium]